MAQQTAIEWFFEQILDDTLDRRYEIFEQANQKFKEQITDAHIEGQRVFDNYPHTQWTNDQAEQYYNETFKQ